MSKPSTASRAISISLAAALLWTVPGLQAAAAAASIVTAVPKVSPVLNAPLAAALAVAPVSSLGLVPAMNLTVAADAAPALAPVFAAAPADSEAQRPSAIGAVRAAAAPVAQADQPSRLKQIYEGAVSGAQRLAVAVLPGAVARGLKINPSLTLAGRARVTLTLAVKSKEDLAQALRNLAPYGFRADSVRSDARNGQAIVSGSNPADSLFPLALHVARAKGVLDVQSASGGSPGDGKPSGFDAAPKQAEAASSKKSEPFVAATRRVAELELLAKSDPARARALAVDYLENSRETRREVRMAALRVLDAAPLADFLPFYMKRLEWYAEPSYQSLKADGFDEGWYIQKWILLRFAREAGAIKDDAAVVAALKAAYADRNASVRLAAASALRAAGVEPGPEKEYLDLAGHDDDAPPVVRPVRTPRPGQKAPRGGSPSRWGAVTALFAMGLILAFAIGNSSHPSPATSPTPASTSQTFLSPAASQTPAFSSLSTNASDSSLLSPFAPETKTPNAAAATPLPTPPTAAESLLAKIAQSSDRAANAQEAQAATAAKDLAEKEAAQKSSTMDLIVSIFIQAAIFLGIIWFASWLIGKLTGRGGASNGNLNAKMSVDANVDKPTQRFNDVEGIDEALVDMVETRDFLRDPRRFIRMGGRAPKGILLEGPPGTGKTLLARALAGETDSAFFAVSGSDFVELFVGMGARRVRDLIDAAAKHKPAIVFIDEIDAVGKARGSGMNGSDSEREQTINALLTKMDGFDNSGGIIFVAATNRAELLDPALTRPGRFDRKIHVGKPHMGGREAIAIIHAKGKRLAPEVDLAYLARRTAGLAGADIENILNEAALQAIRNGVDAIGVKEIDEAIDRGTIGATHNLPMPDALKKRVAYHEAGHMLANMLNENVELRLKPTKYTIVPHGPALGFAEMGNEEGDKYLLTLEELEAKIDIALGGLVAEKLVFGKPQAIPEEFTNRRAEWSTGPGSDLEKATSIASMMVQTLGMGKTTGLAVTAPNRHDPMGRSPFGDVVGAKVWKEVNAILDASYARVTARLTRNRHVLEALTQAVLKKETLIGEEVEAVVREAGVVPPK